MQWSGRRVSHLPGRIQRATSSPLPGKPTEVLSQQIVYVFCIKASWHRFLLCSTYSVMSASLCGSTRRRAALFAALWSHRKSTNGEMEPHPHTYRYIDSLYYRYYRSLYLMWFLVVFCDPIDSFRLIQFPAAHLGVTQMAWILLELSFSFLCCVAFISPSILILTFLVWQPVGLNFSGCKCNRIIFNEIPCLACKTNYSQRFHV